MALVAVAAVAVVVTAAVGAVAGVEAVTPDEVWWHESRGKRDPQMPNASKRFELSAPRRLQVRGETAPGGWRNVEDTWGDAR